MNGSSISHAGADRTIWRLHAAYDPATASFTDLELTSADAGEGFGRFAFFRGDLAVGDRGYAKPPGLQHVLAAGADFLVRVGWNSLRLTTPDGACIDLAGLHGALSPGQVIDVPVVLTRPSRGTGRLSRPLCQLVSSSCASTRRRPRAPFARRGASMARTRRTGRCCR